MIAEYITKNLNHFKQKHDKKAYEKLMEEEFKEFLTAKTRREKIKEAGDLVWVTIGYLWCEFNGNVNKINKLFREIFKSNMSKACSTQKEADATIVNYINHKNYEEEHLRAEKYTDEETGLDYWVICDTRSGKYKKGINYQATDLSWIEDKEL